MGTRLAGKVAIITGATLGLGKAGALAFAREGASVVICDRGRTPENAQKVLAEAEGLSGEIAHKRCDVMIKEDITALVQFTVERYGRVDVMVNNAIIDNPGGMLEDVTLKDWDDGFTCHVTAPLLFCKEVVPLMIKQGSGNIINVSSSTALAGSPSVSSYGPAKAAMINFSSASGHHLWPRRHPRQHAHPRPYAHRKEIRDARQQSGRGPHAEIRLPNGQPRPARTGGRGHACFWLQMSPSPSPATTWSPAPATQHTAPSA